MNSSNEFRADVATLKRIPFVNSKLSLVSKVECLNPMAGTSFFTDTFVHAPCNVLPNLSPFF